MRQTSNIPDKDIPEYVRRCWDQYQSATKHIRETSEESRKMWLGGKHQWRDSEIAARISNNLPYITINRLKPVVDQVENEARNNPPGPQAHPVGGGADKDGADILEGLIREYEYRSDAQRSYVTSLRCAANGNCGAFELATEYAGERTMDQRILVKEVEDPDCLFVDPDARMACREDAMWAGKIRVFSREKLIEEYGSSLKVLNRNMVSRAAGWMQSAVGWRGNQATTNLWTGGHGSDGPYYVCEFYRVQIQQRMLRMYSDNILRFDGETVPKGVERKSDEDGEINRSEPGRKVTKYVVTALDVLDKTEWLGQLIPFFWVMGPEIYIKGKLYRLSLIDGAIDAQRGLNFAATEAVSTVGMMTKSPYIGPLGTFDVTNAQGLNPWETTNVKRWAYLEYKPVFAVDPATGMTQQAPPPSRNAWEAPIARVLELCTFFGEQIKAATSVFFDPNVQSVRDVQSGEAIKALQTQTNIGTLNWQDNLHRAIGLSYNEAYTIMRQIYSGPRVQTIVRADSQHEIARINQEFGPGKKGKRNNITDGEYALRVTSGPNFRTRTEKSIETLTEVFKIAPQILGASGVAAQFLRMVGEGNPQVEQIADTLMGQVNEEFTPEQLQAQLVALRQSDQAKTVLIQKLQAAIDGKLPQVEAMKWKAALDALVRIRVAEITASKDADNANADREAAHLESVAGMAHEVALQADQQQHERDMTMRNAAIAAQSQEQNNGQQPIAA